MTDNSPYTKGIEFEKRVSNYYRNLGFENVQLRERIRGQESDVEHEVDVMIYDDEANDPIIACQCKYKSTGSVTKNDIAKWRDKCDDLAVEPHYASTQFNDGAQKYAARRGVTLVTTADLEGIKVEPESIQEWEAEYSNIDSDADAVLFCLYSITETRILEEATQALNAHPNELEFHNEDIYDLYQNPETQYGTKILLAINRLERSEFTEHAFGSRSKQALNFKQHGEGFQVPPAVGEKNRDIKAVLDQAYLSSIPDLTLDNPGERFEVFLRAWKELAESPVNPRNSGFPGYSNFNHYLDKPGASRSEKGKYVVEFDQDKANESFIENHIEPLIDFWDEYLSRIDDENEVNRLFETDITAYEPGKHHPVFAFGASENTPMLNVFSSAEIIADAASNNKQQIERYLSELKS